MNLCRILTSSRVRKLLHMLACPIMIVGILHGVCSQTSAAGRDTGTEVGVIWLPIGPSFEHSADLDDCREIAYSPNDQRILFAYRTRYGMEGYLWNSEKHGFIEYSTSKNLKADKRHPQRMGVVLHEQLPRSQANGRADASINKLLDNGLLLVVGRDPCALVLADDFGQPVAGRKPVAIGKTQMLSSENSLNYSLGHHSPVHGIGTDGRKSAIGIFDPGQLHVTFVAPIRDWTSSMDSYHVGRRGKVVAAMYRNGIQFSHQASAGAGTGIIKRLEFWKEKNLFENVSLTSGQCRQFINEDHWFLVPVRFDAEKDRPRGLVALDSTTGAMVQRLSMASNSDLECLQVNDAGDVALLKTGNSIELLKLIDGRLTSVLQETPQHSATTLRLLRDARSFELSHSGRHVAFVSGGSSAEARAGVLDLDAIQLDHDARRTAQAEAKAAMLEACRKPLQGPAPSLDRFAGTEIPFELRSIKHPPELIYLNADDELDNANGIEMSATDRWVKIDLRDDLLMLDAATGQKILLNAAHDEQSHALPHRAKGGTSKFSHDGLQLVIAKGYSNSGDAMRLSIWDVGFQAPLLRFHSDNIRELLPEFPKSLEDFREMIVMRPPANAPTQFRLLFATDEEATILELSEGALKIIATGRTGTLVQSYSPDGRYLYSVDKDGAIREFAVSDSGQLTGVRILPGPEPGDSWQDYRLEQPFAAIHFKGDRRYVRYVFDGQCFREQSAFESPSRIRYMFLAPGHQTLAAVLDSRQDASAHSSELVVLNNQLQERSMTPLNINFDKFCVTSDGRYVAALGAGVRGRELLLIRCKQ